jgi:FAD synthetase
MKKVVATGTFDGIHEGHKYFLREAKKLGDWLGVVIALDSTVETIKGRPPRNSQNKRHTDIEALGIADVVIFGYEGDKYQVMVELDPDVIALGYDQKAFTGDLQNKLAERGVDAEIVRIEAFKPDTYKSSLLNKSVR